LTQARRNDNAVPKVVLWRLSFRVVGGHTKAPPEFASSCPLGRGRPSSARAKRFRCLVTPRVAAGSVRVEHAFEAPPPDMQSEATEK